jgi:hypothetical protein
MTKAAMQLKPFLKGQMTPIAGKCGSGFGRMVSWSRKRSKRSVALLIPWSGITLLHHHLLIAMGGGDGLSSQDFPFTLGDPTDVGHITITAVIVVGITDK